MTPMDLSGATGFGSRKSIPGPKKTAPAWSWNGRLVSGWSTVGQRSVNGRSTVGQRSVNGRSTVGQRLYPRLPPDDCWSKNAFLGEKFPGTREVHWGYLDATDCRIIAKDAFETASAGE